MPGTREKIILSDAPAIFPVTVKITLNISEPFLLTPVNAKYIYLQCKDSIDTEQSRDLTRDSREPQLQPLAFTLVLTQVLTKQTKHFGQKSQIAHGTPRDRGLS